MSNLSLESIVEPHVKKILAATGDGTLDITTAHSHLTLSPKKFIHPTSLLHYYYAVNYR